MLVARLRSGPDVQTTSRTHGSNQETPFAMKAPLPPRIASLSAGSHGAWPGERPENRSASLENDMRTQEVIGGSRHYTTDKISQRPMPCKRKMKKSAEPPNSSRGPKQPDSLLVHTNWALYPDGAVRTCIPAERCAAKQTRRCRVVGARCRRPASSKHPAQPLHALATSWFAMKPPAARRPSPHTRR